MTQIPDDHSASIPGQAPSISPAIPSSGPSTQPMAVQASQSQENSIPARKPNKLSLFFHPPMAFPVLARGVSVYTLWKELPTIPDSFPLPPVEIGKDIGKLGSWYRIHLIWKPHSEIAPTPWIDLPETIQAFKVMLDYLDKLVAACAVSAPNAQQTQLVFQILHVRELDAQVPRFYRLRTYRPRHHKSKEDIQGITLNRRRVFVLKLQEQFDLFKENPAENWFPSTFEYYDRYAHSRGWIVISPVQALVAGVSDRVPRILANMLQRHDMNQSGQKGGIASNRYDLVLDRVTLWSSTEEIGEAVDELESLIIGGQKAIDGQVLLTLALALLGALIGLYSTLKLDIGLLWISLLLLSIASVFFWIYARSGVAIWWRLGLLVIVGTLLLDTSPAWYASFAQFFLHLHLR